MAEKINEMRRMTLDEIRHKVEALEKELYGLRCQMNTSQMERPHRVRMLRRDIARHRTILREKELANGGK